jgi:TonB-dependent SusC/RagA subfamily outer membrane receptor
MGPLVPRGRRASIVLAVAALAGLTSPRASLAQASGTIEGTVVDAGSRRPLAGAQVTVIASQTGGVLGTQAGALVGQNGQFRIVGVAPGARQVRARLLGYAAVSRTVQVVAGQTTRADFALQQSAIELTAVVTTGTGGAMVEQRKLGNTVATLEPPPTAPIATFSEMLQGREPGIVALPSSGLTGEGARIRIRGNASMSQSNEPIVYVDGARIDAGGGFGRGFVGTGGGGHPSRLDDIDPNSVERIEVLKGAAAATLYGTEASNGVIVITTKRGSIGAPRWTFQLEQAGSQYPAGRIEPNWGIARTDTQATRLSRFYGQEIRALQPFSREFARRLFETGRSTTSSLSVSGGIPLITYHVGGRFYNEDGPFTAKRFNLPAVQREPVGVRSQDINTKYQGDVAVGISPSNLFRVNVRALYAQTHHEVPENNNSIFSPYTLALFSQPQRAECDASRNLPNAPPDGVAAPERCFGPGNPTGASSFASVRESLQRTIEQDARHFNGVVRASYLPNSKWTFDGTFGIDFVSQRSEAFLPFANNYDSRTNQANQGDKDVDDRSTQVVTLSTNANWSTDFWRNNISSQLLVGAQGFITKENEESSNNQGFPGPGIEVVQGGSSPQVFEFFSSIVNAGYFVQEQLGWRDWLFATLGARYDYNSAFGEEAGGVLYPKASLSIIPSDRPGYAGTRVGRILPTLRLRAAIGQAGRQPGAFSKLTTYEALTSEAGAGLVPSNLGDPGLEPEVSTEWEVGTEFGLFNNRVAIDFTRWERILRDALVPRQFPVTGGFRALQLANIGRMDAWGWDLKVRGFPVNRPNTSIELYANTAFLSQIVRDLGGAPPLKVGGSYPRYRNFIIEGYAPGALLGAALPGSCPASSLTSGRLPAPPGSAPGAVGGICLRPGELPFDTNKDGRPDTEAELLAYFANPLPIPSSASADALGPIAPLAADDDNDRDRLDHYLGKPTPDFQGSFGGNLRMFNNWELATNFEYKFGRYTITDLTGAFRRASPTNGGNTKLRAEVEATLLSPTSTPQQRLEAAKTFAYQLAGLSPFDGLNQNFSGDFLRWRELSLTYHAPQSLAGRVGASSMSITAALRNFALWTRYPGVDPEVNVYGRRGFAGTDDNVGEAIDAFGFPIPRRFSLAVRAAF